jgi:hypothetical protein
MTTTTRTIAKFALIMAIIPAAQACGTTRTVAAGAVAAGAAVAENQNATATINAPISEVDRRARAVLSSMGMTITGADFDNEARQREYDARSGDNVAHIKLEAEGSSTEVSVSYRTGRVDYSESRARDILSRIQSQR